MTEDAANSTRDITIFGKTIRFVTEEFEARFLPPMASATARTNFINLRQAQGESVQNFFARTRETHDRAFPGANADNRDCQHTFIAGLADPALARHVRGRAPGSFNEAGRFAVNRQALETALQRSTHQGKGPHLPRYVIRRQAAGESAISAMSCAQLPARPSKEQLLADLTKPPPRHVQGPAQEATSSREPCWYCNQEDHQRENCKAWFEENGTQPDRPTSTTKAPHPSAYTTYTRANKRKFGAKTGWIRPRNLQRHRATPANQPDLLITSSTPIDLTTTARTSRHN